MSELPSRAQVVIVGGGIVGCSVAYHLAKRGCTDVVLLERKQLTSGTTWHAAGLVGQLRATHNLTRLAKYTTELYATLETRRRPGDRLPADRLARARHQRGALRRAEARRIDGAQLRPRGRICSRRQTGQASCGRSCRRRRSRRRRASAQRRPDQSRSTPRRRWPRVRASRGARIVENVKVNGHRRRRPAAPPACARPPATSRPTFVVNCAGMWAHELGAAAGVTVPLHAAEHFYIVTEPIPGLPTHLPVLRDAGRLRLLQGRCRQAAGRLVRAGRQALGHGAASPRLSASTRCPRTSSTSSRCWKAPSTACRCWPTAGIQLFFNGPESFTPDDRYLLGETPEVRRPVRGGRLQLDRHPVGRRRRQGARRLDRRRPPAHGPVGRRHPPGDAVPAQPPLPPRSHGRGARPALRHALAVPAARDRARRAPLRRCTTAWRPAAPASARSPAGSAPTGSRRDGVEAELRVQLRAAELVRALGRGASGRAQRGRPVRPDLVRQVPCSRAPTPKPSSTPSAPTTSPCRSARIVYTQWLNERGGIEADLTVTRGDRRTASSSSPPRRPRRATSPGCAAHPRADARAVAFDVTSAYAVLGVMGPSSRDLLSALTDADLSNEAFPFGTSQEIDLGYARVRASRVTYVGELGWELYIPTEFAAGRLRSHRRARRRMPACVSPATTP